jgi:hypothetical protein
MAATTFQEVLNEIERHAMKLSKLRVHPNQEYLQELHLDEIMQGVGVLRRRGYLSASIPKRKSKKQAETCPHPE